MTRRVAWKAVVAAAVLLTAPGCSAGDDDGSGGSLPMPRWQDLLTQTAEHAEPTETPSSILLPEPAPPAFTDLDGRWCPTDPPSDWDNPCLDVELPAVYYDGYPDPSYVYLPDGPEDPRTATQADLDFAPNVGECWAMAIDVFPAMSGAALTYCPAGAVAGEQWIDDPWTFFTETWGEDTSDLPDYRDQDRIYIGQDLPMYPYVRSSS